MKPFKIVCGRDPPSIVKYTADMTYPISVRDQLLTRDAILEKLKRNLHRAQQIQSKYADQKPRKLEFQIGDSFLVKLQPYRQHSLALRKNQKLGLRYFGPFNITERIGKVAYKLQLPSTTRIHPIFHTSQLKLCHGDHTAPYVPLPISDKEFSPIIPPCAILKSRVIIRGHQQVPQLLVQWEGLPKEEATWEDQSVFVEAFPTFNLKGKVDFNGREIVIKSMKKGENTAGETLSQGYMASET